MRIDVKSLVNPKAQLHNLRLPSLNLNRIGDQNNMPLLRRRTRFAQLDLPNQRNAA